MLTVFKNVLAKSKSLNVLLGDVVFFTLSEKGASSNSFLEWRVKQSLDGKKLFVSAKFIPDGTEGPEGSSRSYINFPIDAAVRLRDHLNDCIDVAQRLSGEQTN